MPNIKRSDFVQSIAKATGLSTQNAKKVAKTLVSDVTAHPGRTLSKEQEKRAVKALPKALKDLKMKVRGGGLSDERRFKQKFTKTMGEFKEETGQVAVNGKKPLKSAADFLDRVRQGVPGSKETETKRPNVAVSGNALGRQAEPAPENKEIAPKIKAERVSLSDNYANIETIGHSHQNSEPIAPDIG
ncbi:MAG: hypothetical protein AAB779_00575 [Patescibacteria group bacterium]